MAERDEFGRRLYRDKHDGVWTSTGAEPGSPHDPYDKGIIEEQEEDRWADYAGQRYQEEMDEVREKLAPLNLEPDVYEVVMEVISKNILGRINAARK